MKLFHLVSLAIVGLAGGSSAVYASSNKAWGQFNAQVTRASIIASGICDPRASQILGFDNRVGVVTILVSNRSRGSADSNLCLFNKRTRTAHIGSADMCSAPPQVR